MPDEKIVFIAAAFALAGLAKGVIGLGLPTISMGLLAIVMTPLQAAAILVLPSYQCLADGGGTIFMVEHAPLVADAARLMPRHLG
jgi:hypothetical protein